MYMLINFTSLVTKYGKPKGIIHIGAHRMEEKTEYLKHGFNNTIWVEANTFIYEEIKEQKGSEERIFNFAICDRSDEVLDFYITNNNESSSILKLDKHKIHHPNIHETNKILVLSKRMDDLFSENDIGIDNYNFINLDIQGAELMALKGFGNLLKNIDYIYTEVNISNLYENCALMSEIDEYLSDFDFIRAETKLTEYEWGDAFYVKKSILKV